MRAWHLASAFAVGAMLCAMFAGVACGGDSEGESFPEVVTLGAGDVFPAINNSSLAAGPNRLSMSLTDTDDAPVLGAVVRLRFFDLSGSDAKIAFESDARFVPVEFGYVDEQSGGARETTGTGGVYVADVTFSHAGAWGVKVRATVDGRELEEAPFRFNVMEKSAEPAIGDAAPRSRQQVLANASDISDIDSSYPPRPAMHTQTIAEAIDSGLPVVVAFATPAFCTSRTCAPVMDSVMDPLASSYAGRAAFVHVEPFVLRDLRAGFTQNAVPAAREWNLQSEPWVFVIGRDGNVAAKFEGVMALDEVRTALDSALATE